MLNPYETLANAIIEQAAKDHQRATAYLKKNPRTKELAARVATEIAERENAGQNARQINCHSRT